MTRARLRESHIAYLLKERGWVPPKDPEKWLIPSGARQVQSKPGDISCGKVRWHSDEWGPSKGPRSQFERGSHCTGKTANNVNIKKQWQ